MYNTHIYIHTYITVMLTLNLNCFGLECIGKSCKVSALNLLAHPGSAWFFPRSSPGSPLLFTLPPTASCFHHSTILANSIIFFSSYFFNPTSSVDFCGVTWRAVLYALVCQVLYMLDVLIPIYPLSISHKHQDTHSQSHLCFGTWQWYSCIHVCCVFCILEGLQLLWPSRLPSCFHLHFSP